MALTWRIATLRAALALAILQSASTLPAKAQLSEGRWFTVTAEPAKPGLGDTITLTFRLFLNERDLLTDTVPRPTGELAPGLRVISAQHLRRGPDRAFTGTVRVALYRPGKQQLPGFGVPWVQVVTGHRGIVATEPFEIEIASVLPAGNPSLRDIREPGVPRSPAPLWIAAGAAAAAAIAWAASRRRSRQPAAAPPIHATPPPPPEPPDPYREALDRLEQIALRNWAAAGEVALHYEAVADTLRDYLEQAEELPARERTTTELLWSLPPRLSEAGMRRQVQEVLGDADLVKFAKLRPAPTDAAHYTDRARDLLARWHRATAISGATAISETLDAIR